MRPWIWSLGLAYTGCGGTHLEPQPWGGGGSRVRSTGSWRATWAKWLQERERKRKETQRRKELDNEIWEVNMRVVGAWWVFLPPPPSLFVLRQALLMEPGWVLEFQTWTTTSYLGYTSLGLLYRKKKISDENMLKWDFRLGQGISLWEDSNIWRQQQTGKVLMGMVVFMQTVVLGSLKKRTGRVAEGHRTLPALLAKNTTRSCSNCWC